MQRIIRTCLAAAAAAACVAVASSAWAGNATSKEAEAMVKKGVAAIKANGKETTYAQITDKHGPFTDRDLYLTVYTLDGKVLAHGANEKMVGKELIGFKDVDGKEFVKERMELAHAKPSFWQDYKFTNPLTRKVEPKMAYCERVDETVVCGGVYK